MDFNLKWIDDKGMEHFIPLVIDNTFNRYLKEFPLLANTINKVSAIGAQLYKLESLFGNIESPTDLQIADHMRTISKMKTQIESYNSENMIGEFVEKRISLLMWILSKNGYHEHDQLMTPSFWTDYADKESMNELMENIYHKDDGEPSASNDVFHEAHLIALLIRCGIVQNEKEYYDNFDIPTVNNIMQNIADSGTITQKEVDWIWKKDRKLQTGDVYTA